MKDIRKNIIEFIFSAAAAVSLTFNLFLAFLVPADQITNLTGLILVSAFLLLIFRFCFKSLKSTVIFLSAVAVLTILIIPHVITTLHYDIEAISPYLFYIIIFIVSALVYFAAKSKIGVILMFVVGVSIFFYLSVAGFYIYPYAEPVFLVSTGVLFLFNVYIKNTITFKTDYPSAILFTVIASVICLISVGSSQLIYDNIITQMYLPSLTWDQMPSVMRNILQANANTTGFSDYDPGKKLGGAMKYDKAPVLDVKSSNSFYLRGRIYNSYIGDTWLIDNADYEKQVNNSTYWMNTFLYGIDNKYFDANYFKDPQNAASNYYNSHYSAVSNQTMTIKYLSPFKELFLPLDYQKPKVGFAFSDNLTVNSRIQSGYSYNVTYEAIDETTQAYNDFLNNYSTIYNNIVNDSSLSQLVSTMKSCDAVATKDYGKVDVSVSARTIALAKQITANCTNDIQKIDAIKDYLQANYSYAVDTTPPPQGQDLVDYFLYDSKKGYCVHFASSMTVMLRAVGVPARYVEGYISPNVISGDTFHVTNLEAHAWVEAYTPLTGFITVEATPGFQMPPILSSSSSNPYQNSSSKSASNQVSSSQINSASQSAGHGGDMSYNLIKAFLYILGMAVLIILIIGLKVLSRTVWLTRLKARGKNEATIGIYDHFLYDLSLFDLKRMQDETPFEYAHRIKDKLSGGGEGFEKVTQIAVKARYSGVEITNEEYDSILSFNNQFLHLCRLDFGAFKFITRYLIL